MYSLTREASQHIDAYLPRHLHVPLELLMEMQDEVLPMPGGCRRKSLSRGSIYGNGSICMWRR